MICWNCGAELPEGAERCAACEARVENVSPEELAQAEQLFRSLPAEAQEEIEAVFREAETGEEAIRQIFIGDCPNCGSENTQDCEADPDVEDITIARCLDCGQYWCPDCGELFADAQSTDHECPFWDELEAELDELDELLDDEDDDGDEENLDSRIG